MLSTRDAGTGAKYRRLTAEATWVVAGQAVAVAGAVFGLGRLSRFLAPSAYGELTLALTVSNLVGLVFLGPIAAACGRYAAVAPDARALHVLVSAARQFNRERVRYIALGGAATAIVAAAFGRLTFAFFAAAATIFACVSNLTILYEGILDARRLRRVVAAHRAMQVCLNYGFALLLLTVGPRTSTVALFGFCAGAWCTALSEAAVIRRRTRAPTESMADEDQRASLQKLRVYARPYERWGIFNWLQTTSDRWALAALTNTGQVGLYAVVYQLGFSPLALLSNMFSRTVEPVIYQRAGQVSGEAELHHAHVLRRRTIWVFAAVGAGAFLVTATFHDAIFRLLIDRSYWSASGLLPWMTLASALAGIGQLESIKWLARLQPERLQMPRVVLSLIGAAMVVCGVWFAGAAGAAAGQVASALVFLIWMLLLR